MKNTSRLISFFLILFFTISCASSKSDSLKTPWKRWYFAFTTPKSFPAQVTLLKLLDIDGYASTYRTIDQPRGISTERWSEKNSAGNTQFNQAKRLPQIMMFCWDSIIDKKTYQSTLFFTQDTWRKMISPYPDVLDPGKNAYRQIMLIGLAPEGKVRVWLRQYGHSDIPLIDTEIITVSGKELDMCKGVTGHPDGYVYYGDAPDFIKDKKYPYGIW
ncbi:lipoprotein [Pantoea sp. PSNIH1]|nr:lipoprotein [Pantoea sp. PSNIH1]